MLRKEHSFTDVLVCQASDSERSSRAAEQAEQASQAETELLMNPLE